MTQARQRLSSARHVIPGELARSAREMLVGPDFILVLDGFKASADGITMSLNLLSKPGRVLDAPFGLPGPEGDPADLATWLERGDTVVLSHIQSGAINNGDGPEPTRSSFELWFDLDVHHVEDLVVVVAQWPSHTSEQLRISLAGDRLREAASRAVELV